MLKKIIAAALLSGFIGILIFGGVYRTKARTNDNDGKNAKNQDALFSENLTSEIVQQTHNSEHDAFADEEGHHGGADGQANMNVQNRSPINSENQAEMGKRGKGNQEGRGRENGNGQAGELDLLTSAEIEALKLALNDEYHALAVYKSVIAKFGEVDPFIEIAASEQRHVDALVNQFYKHGLSVPENTWIGNVSPYESIQQACQAGVEAEIANVDLYDQLFSMTDDPSLTRVFGNLSKASMNSHLPQFEACQ
jgi:hypothetical protein